MRKFNAGDQVRYVDETVYTVIAGYIKHMQYHYDIRSDEDQTIIQSIPEDALKSIFILLKEP